MSKLKIFLIASLILLGLLMARVFVMPLAGSDQKYSEVASESLLKTPDGWILQFDIENKTSETSNYFIYISVDGKQYKDSFQISPGGLYTYIHMISPTIVVRGEVSVKIIEEGKDTPFEQGTYYLT